MVDIVSANEFTFTPSAFLAAYIEQDVTSSITEVTGNGGSLVTNPNTISNLNSASTSIPESTGSTLYFNKETTGPMAEGFFSGDAALSSLSLTGTEIVGQTVNDTRTTTKTTTTSAGVNNTVVLVLSYGQFRSKCANAQATVTKIYQEVAAYLNSL